MSDIPTILWPGRSGKKHKYFIYPMGTSFKDAPGNYIFAKKTPAGKWTPIYIGQTTSLADRLVDHEKAPCAERHGATHIHVHVNRDEQTRLAEERDLILKWRPPCNDQ